MPFAPNKHSRARLGKQHIPKEAQRKNSNQRGYNYKWQQARAGYLKRHPLCVHCDNDNKVKPAKVVDHIIPHKGDMKLFWDRSNWQGLCKTHHDIKTAKEDGGFGNRIKI